MGNEYLPQRIVRKFHKIGINMQSLYKIGRGLNYPAYETLEKIMEVLDVTPKRRIEVWTL